MFFVRSSSKVTKWAQNHAKSTISNPSIIDRMFARMRDFYVKFAQICDWSLCRIRLCANLHERLDRLRLIEQSLELHASLHGRALFHERSGSW